MSEKLKTKDKTSQETPRQNVAQQSKIGRIKVIHEIIQKYGQHFQYDKKEKAFRMTRNHDTLSLKTIVPSHINAIHIKPNGSKQYYKLTRFPEGTTPKYLVGQFQCPAKYPGTQWKGRAGIYKNYLVRFASPSKTTPQPQTLDQNNIRAQQPFLLVPKYAKYFTKIGDGYEMKKNIDWINLKKIIPPNINQIRIQATKGGKIFTLHRFENGGHFKAPEDFPKWLKVSYRKTFRAGIYKGIKILQIPQPIPQPPKKTEIEITLGKIRIEAEQPKIQGSPGISLFDLQAKQKVLRQKFAPYLEKLYQYVQIQLPKLKKGTKTLGKATINRSALALSEDTLQITDRYGRPLHECSKYMRYFFGKLLNVKDYRELTRRGGIYQNAWDIWAFTKFREKTDRVKKGTYSRMAGDINLNFFYHRPGQKRIYLPRRVAESDEYRDDMATLFQGSLKTIQNGNVAQVIYYYRGSGNQARAIRAQRKLKIALGRGRNKYLKRPEEDRTYATHVEPLIGTTEAFFYKKQIEKTARRGDYLNTLIRIYANQHFARHRNNLQKAFDKFKILKDSKTKLFLTDQEGNKKEVTIKENPNNSLLGYSLYYKDTPNQPIQFNTTNRQYFSFTDLATQSYKNVDQKKGSSTTISILDSYLRYTGHGVPRRLPIATIEYPGVKWSSFTIDQKQPLHIQNAQQQLQQSVKKYVVINPNLKRRTSIKETRKQFDKYYYDTFIKKHGYTEKDKNLYIHAIELVGLSFGRNEILKVPLPIFDPKVLRSKAIRQAINSRDQINKNTQLREKMAPTHHILEIKPGSQPWHIIQKQLLPHYPYFNDRKPTPSERQFILHQIDRLNSNIDFTIVKQKDSKRLKRWTAGELFFVPKKFMTDLIKTISKHRQLSRQPLPKEIFAGLDKNKKWIRTKIPKDVRFAIMHTAPHDPEIRRLLLGVYAREQGRGSRRKALKNLVSKLRPINSLGILQVRPQNFNISLKIANGKTIKLWKSLFPKIKNYQEFKQKLKDDINVNIKAAAYLLRQHRRSVHSQLKLLSPDPNFAKKNPLITTIAILSSYNSRPTAITEATIDVRLKYLRFLFKQNGDLQQSFNLQKYQPQINSFVKRNAPKLSLIRREGSVRKIIRFLGGKRTLVSHDQKHLITTKVQLGITFYSTGLYLKDKFPDQFTDMTTKQIEQAAVSYMHNPLTPLLHQKITNRIQRLSSLEKTPARKLLIQKLQKQELAGRLYNQIINLCISKTGQNLNKFMIQYHHLFQKGLGYSLNYGLAVMRGKKPQGYSQFATIQYQIPNTNQLLNPPISKPKASPPPKLAKL